MSKVLLSLLLLAFVAYALQKQIAIINIVDEAKSFGEENGNKEKHYHDRIRFGIGGAISYNFPSKLIFNDVGSLEYAEGLGFKIGTLLNIPIYTTDMRIDAGTRFKTGNRQLSFSPELYYVYREFSSESITKTITEHIISVPLLFKYWFLDADFLLDIERKNTINANLYFEGGIQFGFPIKTMYGSNVYSDRNELDFEIVIGYGFGWEHFLMGMRLGYTFGAFNKTVKSSLGPFLDFLTITYYF